MGNNGGKWKKSLAIGVGAIGMVASTVGCSKGTEEPVKPVIETETQMQTNIETETQMQTNTESIVEKKNEFIKKVVEKYNKEHPEDQRSESDLSMISRENIQYLVKQTNNDGTVVYIQDDYTTGETLEANQEHIYSDEIHIGNAYFVVDKTKKDIIAGIGEIGYDNFVDIAVKIDLKINGNTYVAQENQISVVTGGKDPDKKTYEDAGINLYELVQKKEEQQKLEELNKQKELEEASDIATYYDITPPEEAGQWAEDER